MLVLSVWTLALVKSREIFLFLCIHICADINTVFALKFDDAKIGEWLRITAITCTLSLTVMSFVKIFMAWLLPPTFLGFAIIALSIGFIIVAGVCEELVTNTVGDTAVGVCS